MTEEKLKHINDVLMGIQEIEANIDRIDEIIAAIYDKEDYTVSILKTYHNKPEVFLSISYFKLDFVEFLKGAKDRLIKQKHDLEETFREL